MLAPGRTAAKLAALAASTSVVVFSAQTAHATDCTGTLASTCINDDTLWPHVGAAHFIGVGGTETIAAGNVGFGLVTSYLSRPIVIHTASPGPTGTGTSGADQYAVNDQVNSSFLWGYGVTDRLQLDFLLPITLGQGGSGVGPITGGAGLQDTAVRDLRFGFAYALLPRPRISPDVPASSALAKKSAFALTARAELSAPTGDRDQFAGERSVVWLPSVAADYRRGRWFAGLEVGARLRPTTELIGARIGTQLYSALGAGVDILDRERLSAGVEARALPTFAEQHDATVGAQGLMSVPNGKHVTPAEWTVSVRTAPLVGGDLAFQLGGGGAIPLASDPAPTTPRFRFTLSIRYAPLARDTDGDGVLDKDDKCPSIQGTMPDGCLRSPLLGAPGPGAAQPTQLSPSTSPAITLHLRDAKDTCTSEPDSADGFRDDNGCPDEDSDKDGIDDRDDKCPMAAEDFAGLPDGCPDTPKATP